MTSAATRTRSNPALLATLAAGLLGLALLVVGAPPAAAHNSLVSTDPPDGATVAGAPDRVTLVFDQPAQELGTEIVVTGPDGTVVSTGTVELADTSVAQPLVADRPAGAYTVQWRVTSADGHPLSGTLTFTATEAVGAAVPSPVAETAEPADPPASPTPTVAAGTDASPTATFTATEDADALAEDEDAGFTAVAVVVGVVVLLAVGAVVVLVRRERHKARPAPSDDGADPEPRDG